MKADHGMPLRENMKQVVVSAWDVGLGSVRQLWRALGAACLAEMKLQRWLHQHQPYHRTLHTQSVSFPRLHHLFVLVARSPV